jgi:hypothetical protein
MGWFQPRRPNPEGKRARAPAPWRLCTEALRPRPCGKQSHAAQGREAVVHRRANPLQPQSRRAVTVSHRSYPQGVAFTWRPYRVIGDANSTAVAWITARVVGGEDLSAAADLIHNRVLYHGECSSDSLTEQLQGNFSLYFSWQLHHPTAPKL